MSPSKSLQATFQDDDNNDDDKDDDTVLIPEYGF